MEEEIKLLRRIKLIYNKKLYSIIDKGECIASDGNMVSPLWALLTHDGYKELIDEHPDMAIMPLGRSFGLFRTDKEEIGFCNWAFFIREHKGKFFINKKELKLPNGWNTNE